MCRNTFQHQELFCKVTETKIEEKKNINKIIIIIKKSYKDLFDIFFSFDLKVM